MSINLVQLTIADHGVDMTRYLRVVSTSGEHNAHKKKKLDTGWGGKANRGVSERAPKERALMNVNG
jgi:hypothetical protein